MSALPPIPASKYLIDDRPLVIKLQLVRLIGFKPAIVLQQVRYWLGEDRKPQIREGRPWVYNTYPDWQKQFPFWPVSTVKETFLELEREGLLLSGHFNTRNTDRTKWYTIPPNVIRDLDRRAQADAAWTHRRRGGRAADAALPAIPESNLLIDRDTLIILPRLATRIGLNEAIILQQMFYWLGGDRKPHVRDGRRWVYNTYEGWREQFPFWSERTIRRTIRRLEELSLLESAYFSDHPESRHLDHTKWYTIAFDRLAALEAVAADAQTAAAEIGQESPMEAANKHHSGAVVFATRSGQESPLGVAKTRRLKRPEIDNGAGLGARLEAADDHRWNRPRETDGALACDRGKRPDRAVEPARSRHSSSTETTPETTPESIQKQQQVVGNTNVGDEGNDVVVVAIDPALDIAARLVERGVTVAIARKLARDYAAAIVARQIEVFDWLREIDPHDERYTAGRLRKMIEEDWTPPPGFEPAAIRAARADAAAEAERRAREERERWLAEQDARRASEDAEWRAMLERIGVTAADQEEWRQVSGARPPLAAHFRRAFFYAPRGGDPALVILRDEADWELVRSDRAAKEQAEVERRVAKHYRRPFVEVAYAHYEMIATLLSDGMPEPMAQGRADDAPSSGTRR